MKEYVLSIPLAIFVHSIAFKPYGKQIHVLKAQISHF